MGELEKELGRLKEQLEKARAVRSRAEAQLEVLEREKQRILAELEEMGVHPEQLDRELAHLEQEMGQLLGQVRQVLAGGRPDTGSDARSGGGPDA